MKKQVQWGVQYTDGTCSRVTKQSAFYRDKKDPRTDKEAAKAEIEFMAKYGECLSLVKRNAFTIKGKNGETVKIKTKWVKA